MWNNMDGQYWKMDGHWLERQGGKVSFWKRHRKDGDGDGNVGYCLSFGSSKNAHGFCNWGSSRSSSRRLPLAPRACRVKMGLRLSIHFGIANSSRPAATSVKFAPARRRQNTQPPGWRLNMSFATLWRGWRRLEKTIGTLESTCIVILFWRMFFCSWSCAGTPTAIYGTFLHFSWKADFMRPKRSQNPRKKRKKNAKTANGEEVEHSD